jgi:hypothetical protein
LRTSFGRRCVVFVRAGVGGVGVLSSVGDAGAAPVEAAAELVGGSVVVNGGFERVLSGHVDDGWATGGQAGVVTGAGGAHGGVGYAELAGDGNAGLAWLSQNNVTVPDVSGGSAELSFWTKITTAETADEAHDQLTVVVSDGQQFQPVATLTDLDVSAGFVERVVDLSAFKGRTVTLTFFGAQDPELTTTFGVDDVVVKAVDRVAQPAVPCRRAGS